MMAFFMSLFIGLDCPIDVIPAGTLEEAHTRLFVHVWINWPVVNAQAIT